MSSWIKLSLGEQQIWNFLQSLVFFSKTTLSVNNGLGREFTDLFKKNNTMNFHVE